jgi:hypothetical protein
MIERSHDWPRDLTAENTRYFVVWILCFNEGRRTHA